MTKQTSVEKTVRDIRRRTRKIFSKKKSVLSWKDFVARRVSLNSAAVKGLTLILITRGQKIFYKQVKNI